jgi:hypothetical protein
LTLSYFMYIPIGGLLLAQEFAISRLLPSPEAPSRCLLNDVGWLVSGGSSVTGRLRSASRGLAQSGCNEIARCGAAAVIAQ